MAKRIVTKIGNVFCAEINGEYKSYFQYVCNDINQLNSSVIRVFKTRYPMEYEPVLKDIINDEIAFYAHTVIRAGIDFNAWYKVGKPVTIDNSKHDNVLWGTTSDILTISAWDYKEVNPLENWDIWYINRPRIKIGLLPKEYWGKIESGTVKPFIEIVDRIKYGYYKYQSPIYDIIKRIPHPDVNSYTRREIDNTITYRHHLGEYVLREITIHVDDQVELSEGKPLDRPKFWETNWKHKEFISEEEFNKTWEMYSK